MTFKITDTEIDNTSERDLWEELKKENAKLKVLSAIPAEVHLGMIVMQLIDVKESIDKLNATIEASALANILSDNANIFSFGSLDDLVKDLTGSEEKDSEEDPDLIIRFQEWLND